MNCERSFLDERESLSR